jgi:hypothetical protein
MRVFLFADGGGKEFEEAAGGVVAGGGDGDRHGEAAATVTRCRGCPGPPNRDELIHGVSYTNFRTVLSPIVLLLITQLPQCLCRRRYHPRRQLVPRSAPTIPWPPPVPCPLLH